MIHHMSERFADGIRFLDLQGRQTTADLISAIADGVGITLSGQEQPAEQLLRFLHHKQMLIALDNFEQMLNASHFGLHELSLRRLGSSCWSRHGKR